MLGSIVVVFKTHSLKARHASAAEINSKVEQATYFKTIGTTDFDMVQGLFEVRVQQDARNTNLIIPTPSALGKRSQTVVVDEGSQTLNSSGIPRDKPREERYGGGQMSLRGEKKNLNKPAM